MNQCVGHGNQRCPCSNLICFPSLPCVFSDSVSSVSICLCLSVSLSLFLSHSLSLSALYLQVLLTSSGLAQHPLLSSRAVARILLGVASPCFPTYEWKQCPFWGRYAAHRFKVVQKAAQVVLEGPWLKKRQRALMS